MLYILMLLMIVLNVSFFATAARLQAKHRDVFDRLGLDGSLFVGSITQFAKVVEFIVKRKHAELDDLFLEVSGYAFVASLIITLPAVILWVLLA